MRQVFTGREVPHIFATRQDSARNANRTLWCNYGTLYSYSEPIARFYGDSVLISADNFSVTTSKRMSWARYALRHIEQIKVPNLKALCDILASKRERDALDYINARIADIESLEKQLPRKRSEWKIAQCRAEIAMHEHGAEIAWRAIGKKSDWRKVAGKALATIIRKEKRDRYNRAGETLAAYMSHGFALHMERLKRELESAQDSGTRRILWRLDNAISLAWGQRFAWRESRYGSICRNSGR